MDEITIDRQTLKALATDTRISILKHLASRRMTQAELAQSIGISAPSVSEHVRSLSQAGLITTIDEGRKWKYFELTQKGSAIVKPSNTRVWFLLAISLLALTVAGSGLYSRLSLPVYGSGITLAAPMFEQGAFAIEGGRQAAGQQLPADAGQTPEAAGVPLQAAKQSTQDQATQAADALTPPSPPAEGPAATLLNQMPLAESIAVLASVLALGFALGLLARERE